VKRSRSADFFFFTKPIPNNRARWMAFSRAIQSGHGAVGPSACHVPLRPKKRCAPGSLQPAKDGFPSVAHIATTATTRGRTVDRAFPRGPPTPKRAGDPPNREFNGGGRGNAGRSPPLSLFPMTVVQASETSSRLGRLIGGARSIEVGGWQVMHP